jgi:hypothetical protein
MPKVYSHLVGREIEVSAEEYARREAARQARNAPPPVEPPPSYELIVAERGMDGEIKRMILRPIEPEAAEPAKAKAAA